MSQLVHSLNFSVYIPTFSHRIALNPDLTDKSEVARISKFSLLCVLFTLVEMYAGKRPAEICIRKFDYYNYNFIL